MRTALLLTMRGIRGREEETILLGGISRTTRHMICANLLWRNPWIIHFSLYFLAILARVALYAIKAAAVYVSSRGFNWLVSTERGLWLGVEMGLVHPNGTLNYEREDIRFIIDAYRLE